MHGTYLVKTFEPIKDLLKKLQGFVFSESFFLCQIFLDVTAIAELCDDEHLFLCWERIHVFDDILTFAPLENCNLGLNEFLELRSLDHKLPGYDLT